MKEIIGVIGLVVAVLGFIFGGPAGLLSFYRHALDGARGAGGAVWNLASCLLDRRENRRDVPMVMALFSCGGIVVRHPHGNRMSSRPKPILSLGASDGEGCRIRRPGVGVERMD